MADCSKCTRTDIKCCFTCKKDAEKCKVYHHCGSDCSKHEYRKITNADKIRSMSDEELADFIAEHNQCCLGGTGEIDCAYNADCHNCKKYVLKWLKSEAE